MHNFSLAKREKFLRTGVVIFGLQLLSFHKFSLDIPHYFGFEQLTGSGDQCPSVVTEHPLH